MAEESKPSRLVAQVDPDKHRRSLALDERPDSRSGFRACRMIGSVNAPFPSNMTRRLPWRSIDDPRRSLTALTRRAAGEGRLGGGRGGSKPACRRCNRRECFLFAGLRLRSAVSGFRTGAQEPESPIGRFHVASPAPRYGPENRSSLIESHELDR